MTKTALLLLILTPGALLICTNPALAQSSVAAAQDDVSIALTAVGLATFQPVDDFYVGSPYLDKGLGGMGAGLAIGANLTAGGRFAAALELSTAEIRVEQAGRLVGGEAIGRLRDTLVSALVGVARSSSRRSTRFLAGISRVIGVPSLDGVRIDQEPGDQPVQRQRLAFTTGLDVSQAISSRVGFLATVRYSYLRRTRRATEIGVGHHVFRAGVGISIALID